MLKYSMNICNIDYVKTVYWLRALSSVSNDSMFITLHAKSFASKDRHVSTVCGQARQEEMIWAVLENHASWRNGGPIEGPP